MLAQAARRSASLLVARQPALAARSVSVLARSHALPALATARPALAVGLLQQRRGLAAAFLDEVR